MLSHHIHHTYIYPSIERSYMLQKNQNNHAITIEKFRRLIHICRGDRGSLGQKIHFTAYFFYELAIWNTQNTCLYLYIISIGYLEAL